MGTPRVEQEGVFHRRNVVALEPQPHPRIGHDHTHVAAYEARSPEKSDRAQVSSGGLIITPSSAEAHVSVAKPTMLTCSLTNRLTAQSSGSVR